MKEFFRPPGAFSVAELSESALQQCTTKSGEGLEEEERWRTKQGKALARLEAQYAELLKTQEYRSIRNSSA